MEPTREELIEMLRTVSNAVQMPRANTQDTARADFTTGEQDSGGWDLIRMRMVVIESVRDLLARVDEQP